ncbi:helix-turn-helix domain-containing protein [Caldiplasma sukawensis]
MTKARLPISSPLDSLTCRQLVVLKESYYSGYYDIPRKINSDQVAKKL